VQAEGPKATTIPSYSADDDFRSTAYVKSRAEYEALYAQSISDPEAFWGNIASQFYWEEKVGTTSCVCVPGRSFFTADGAVKLFRCCLQWEPKHFSFNFDVRKGKVFVEWFKGGKTNLSYNCLDRNIQVTSRPVLLLSETSR
jgi:acetyl-CoA synthetase